MSPRKTKISFQINKGAAASKPVTSCKASLNITCHHFTAPFRSLILYTICLFKQSTLYIHFIKTLQWLISKSKNWHHTKRAALVHGSDQPSQKKNHILYGPRPPQASDTTERHPEKDGPWHYSCPKLKPAYPARSDIFPTSFSSPQLHKWNHYAVQGRETISASICACEMTWIQTSVAMLSLSTVKTLSQDLKTSDVASIIFKT